MEFSRKHLLAGGAVLVVGLLLFVSFRRTGSSVRLPDRIKMFCVETGEFQTKSRSEIKSLPALNPKTGNRSFVPCFQENGQWFVDDRYRNVISDFAGAGEQVDEETMKIMRPPP